jgi:uncharacterized Zn finger protein
MSDLLQSSPPKLPPRLAEPLRCPRCQSGVAIQHRALSRLGFEHWTLRCTECGLVHEAQIMTETTTIS